jgi:putative PEP-CTERM system TPR-repeat lipoprotein
LRARTLIANKDKAGARQNFEQALKISPTYLPAAIGLASLDVADKNVAQAKQRFDDVLRTDPKNVGAMLAAAELTARIGGAPDEILAWIKKAVAANPTDVSARLALVEFYLKTNDPKTAVTVAHEAVAAIPDRAEILDAAGRAEAASGDTNQALNTFAKLTNMQPDSPVPYMRMATVQVAAGQKDSAAESLRHALRLQPKLLEAQRALVALLVSTGQKSEALSVVRDIKTQRPKESVAYIVEGDTYALLKSLPEAITAFQTGLKTAPSTQLATQLHSAYLANSNKADADTFAQSWIKDHPKDVGFRLYLADRANVSKDYPAAIAHYRAALSLQPDNPAIMNNLAWNLSQVKDPKALEYAESANRLAQNQPAFMDTLAMILMDSGNIDRATTLSEQASKLAPQNPSIRLDYARVLIKAGKKTDAKRELDTLAKLGEKFNQQAEVRALQGQL